MAVADLALRLTLLALLLRPVGGVTVRPAIQLLAAAGLLWPRALRSPLLWLALALLLALRIVLSWPLGDNHAYLFAVWALAAALATRGSDTIADLAWNGRLLIGLAFTFAMLWKAVLSPDFLDGTFFRATLVLDPRMDALARALGGLSQAELAPLRDALTAPLSQGASVAPPPPIPRPLTLAAQALTLSSLALEGAVALTFLAPAALAQRSRDPLLLVFCATTYAVAPVRGFGWLLLAMGVAQTAPEASRTRAAYLGVYALLVLYGALA
jgi:hypothetical protein